MCNKSNLPDFWFWFIQFVNLDLYSFNHSFNMFWEKLIQKNIHFFCQRVSFNSKNIHSKEIPANSLKKKIMFLKTGVSARATSRLQLKGPLSFIFLFYFIWQFMYPAPPGRRHSPRSTDTLCRRHVCPTYVPLLLHIYRYMDFLFLSSLHFAPRSSISTLKLNIFSVTRRYRGDVH